jgi:hypothetical protein
MFAANLAGGIIAFVFKDEVQTGFLKAMNELMEDYQEETYAKQAWDGLQTEVSC